MNDEPSLAAYFIATCLALLWTAAGHLYSAALWTVGAVWTLQYMGIL